MLVACCLAVVSEKGQSSFTNSRSVLSKRGSRKSGGSPLTERAARAHAPLRNATTKLPDLVKSRRVPPSQRRCVSKAPASPKLSVEARGGTGGQQVRAMRCMEQGRGHALPGGRRRNHGPHLSMQKYAGVCRPPQGLPLQSCSRCIQADSLSTRLLLGARRSCCALRITCGG